MLPSVKIDKTAGRWQFYESNENKLKLCTIRIVIKVVKHHLSDGLYGWPYMSTRQIIINNF